MHIEFEIQFEVLEVDEIGEMLREASIEQYIKDDGVDNVINNMKDDFVERRKVIIEEIIDKINNEYGTECSDLSLFNFCHYESFFDVYADTKEELDELQGEVIAYIVKLEKEYKDILEIDYYVSESDYEEEEE